MMMDLHFHTRPHPHYYHRSKMYHHSFPSSVLWTFSLLLLTMSSYRRRCCCHHVNAWSTIMTTRVDTDTTRALSSIDLQRQVVRRERKRRSLPSGSDAFQLAFPSSISSLSKSPRSSSSSSSLSMSMVGGSSSGTSGTSDQFEDFNIDDVLLEAEAALEVAEISLTVTEDDKDEDDETETERRSQQPMTTTVHHNFSSRLTTASQQQKTQTEQGQLELKDVVSCTTGGFGFGLVLGLIIALRYSTDLLLVVDNPLVEIPLTTGVVLGIMGLVGSSTTKPSSMAGRIVRIVFGQPILLLGNAIIENAQRKVEQTKQEIQMLPGQVADSIKTSAQTSIQTAVEEVKSIPQKATDQILESGLFDRDILVAIFVIPSLVAIIVLTVDAVVSGRGTADILSSFQ